jgi:hypothetical protein
MRLGRPRKAAPAHGHAGTASVSSRRKARLCRAQMAKFHEKTAPLKRKA